MLSGKKQAGTVVQLSWQTGTRRGAIIHRTSILVYIDSVGTMQQDLIAQYKKNGAFDAKRKAWFAAVDADEELQKKLNTLVHRLVRVKIEKDPELVMNDSGSGSGKLSALIQTELVKRHVQKSKTADKGDAPADVSLSNVETMSETELLDTINALVAISAKTAQQEGPVDLTEHSS